ncbi:MAG: DinB family protein [Isosphaeraceae bacterium]|nr:DinB family protein [Isosphaeraceae bacterium]
MQAKDVIRNSLETSDFVLQSYIGDLDDADLLIRPVPGMNHIAWQLGHLIATERRFVEAIQPGSCPPLPEGFDDGHGRMATGVDDPSKFYPRARYQELWKAQRAATHAVLERLSEADLDRTDPERFPSFAPTVGAILNLCGTHALMHAGQFVGVRRKLGKPVTI